MSEISLEKNLAKEQIGSSVFTKIIMALQHLIAMFGATVLVPILTGMDPSVAIFTAGVGTLIFHLCTKGKVPVFLGSSFAFIPVILTVKEMYGGDLAYAQGGIIVAGLIYVILAGVISIVGHEKIIKLFPSQVVGPMIIVIGMNLLPTAINMASENFLIAGFTLFTVLFVKRQFKGIVSQMSILIAIIAGFIFSMALNMVDFTTIHEAEILSVPAFRLPKFDFGAVAVIAPVVLAVFMEHVGDITTNGQVVGKNFVEDPGLHRTLLGDGLATMFAGFVGGPANTTYGENTGVLAFTKNYNPEILRLAAVFAIILAFVGKLGALLLSIPSAVMGGISVMLFSMISIVGVKTVKRDNVFENKKNIIVMAVILILGLGSGYIEKIIGFPIEIHITNDVAITGLSFAAIVGIVVNLILNGLK